MFGGTAAAILIVVLVLAAIVGPQQQAALSGQSSTAMASTSPTPRPTVPDVVGATVADADPVLLHLGALRAFKGPDGVAYTAPDSAKVTGTVPAAGATLPAGATLVVNVDITQKDAQAKAAAAARATRYAFKCWEEGSSRSAPPTTFNDFHAIWPNPKMNSCDLTIGGQELYSAKLEDDEKQAVQQLAADGGDASSPGIAYGETLLACAVPPTVLWERERTRPQAVALAKAALRMCPDAPFASELQRIGNGIPPGRFADGTYVVGKDIQAGTYQVKGGQVHDCYWERTGAQGGTIANDYITFAPQGPVVTVYVGEGFVSERCGEWSKIG